MPTNRDNNNAKRSEQNVLNSSYDQDFDVLATEGLGYDGVGLQRMPAKALAIKITESGNYTYIALAKPGTAQATNKWQVKRIDESEAGSVVVTFADGDCNFNNVATDLTALTYS